MANLKINHDKINAPLAEALVSGCPFGAISYENEKLSISSACKMCKICVKRSEGAIEYINEEAVSVDKSLWRGICVYADCQMGEIHRVTFELCGKAKELAKVTGHPIYALLIGENIGDAAAQLLHYGVDRVFTYDNPAFANFRIEPYTEAFCDFIEKVKPSSVMVGATALGRQLAPRVAARCRAGLTADCTVLEMKENTDLVQIRPSFGGNIMAQIVSPNTRPQFCTVRYKVFSEPKPSDAICGEIINMSIDESKLSSKIDVISVLEKPKDVDISEAEIIVAIGRGAQSANIRAMAEELADLLGGMRAVKYGVTRDYVRSLTVVMPNGEILTLGANVAKDSSGYSLKDLVIGSEGTLCIICEAVLKLVPLPKVSISLLVPFSDMKSAIEAVPKIICSNITPTAIEYMSRDTILFSESYLGKKFPDTKNDAYILLTFDGNTEAQVEEDMNTIANLCLEIGALDAYIVDTEERKKSVWSSRGAFLEAIKASTTEMDECDVVVPRNKVDEFIKFTHDLAKEMNIRIPSFGHAGDGNLHIYLP